MDVPEPFCHQKRDNKSNDRKQSVGSKSFVLMTQETIRQSNKHPRGLVTLCLRPVQPKPSQGMAGKLLVRSGPWCFLPPRHTGHLPVVPCSAPAFPLFLTVLQVLLGPPLWAQLPHPITAELRAGNA